MVWFDLSLDMKHSGITASEDTYSLVPSWQIPFLLPLSCLRTKFTFRYFKLVWCYSLHFPDGYERSPIFHFLNHITAKVELMIHCTDEDTYSWRLMSITWKWLLPLNSTVHGRRINTCSKDILNTTTSAGFSIQWRCFCLSPAQQKIFHDQFTISRLKQNVSDPHTTGEGWPWDSLSFDAVYVYSHSIKEEARAWEMYGCCGGKQFSGRILWGTGWCLHFISHTQPWVDPQWAEVSILHKHPTDSPSL